MIVGTAGHIDHGKTALVRTLTGVDTDRLKEEKTRGISIDLGFAYLPAPDGGVLGFVDVPGHERFVRNMLAGATGIDFVLFVVAADDGVMPQTIEHLAIVDLLGIDRGIVALTKTDLVTPERVVEVTAEIEATLSATAISTAEIIPISVISGSGISELRTRLFDAARSFGRRTSTGRFRLAVDRSFTLNGIGTVVTGTVLSGSVAVGDHIVVSPSGIKGQVRSIHAQNRLAESGNIGDRCAINLTGRDIHKDAIVRGDVILDPILHAPADRIDASISILSKELKAVTQWYPVRLHHATADVGARVNPLSDDIIAPGLTALAQLVLEHPIAAAAGDRFILRDTSGQRTIGGGRFIDLRAPARKRRQPERLAQLHAHANIDPQNALTALLSQPSGFTDLTVFSRDRALSAREIDRLITRTGVIKVIHDEGVVALASTTWSQLLPQIRVVLNAFHTQSPDLPGLGIERLRLRIEPRFPKAVFTVLLQRLARTREIVLDGNMARLSNHKVEMKTSDADLWQRVNQSIGGDARFRPPRVRDIANHLGASEQEIRRIMQLAGRKRLVHEIAQDQFLTRSAVIEIVELVYELANSGEDGTFPVAQLRDRLNTSRKIAVEVLEFFDRAGVTTRRGALRRVNRMRIQPFRASLE